MDVWEKERFQVMLESPPTGVQLEASLGLVSMTDARPAAVRRHTRELGSDPPPPQPRIWLVRKPSTKYPVVGPGYPLVIIKAIQQRWALPTNCERSATKINLLDFPSFILHTQGTSEKSVHPRDAIAPEMSLGRDAVPRTSQFTKISAAQGCHCTRDVPGPGQHPQDIMVPAWHPCDVQLKNIIAAQGHHCP
ncbi:hypothetical protein PGT21_037255 [Puccinia graminis f. sp. tritici]|uniref:Uncharacterized protein n=1 Tax=Puccinia graminis f. sp. tritici TaxID=56615 RepID=A0A5B0R3X8_PUCGR|nr:hypothetical protein PGT21_037255 [Puccinia graminis f. sp. tritici]